MAKENGYYLNDNLCARSAENGYFAILKWIRQNGSEWDYRTCASAAENGHFEAAALRRTGVRASPSRGKFLNGLKKMDVHTIFLNTIKYK
jgi:hypothetical protein